MNSASDEQAFRERVMAHMDGLPPQQQLVGEFMLDHMSEIPFSSVPELAMRIKVSEATVVRFAQRVGYDGFSGLKTELMEMMKGKMVPTKGVGAVFRAPVQSDTLAAAAQQEIDNITQSLGAIDKHEFHRAANALFRADHIYTFGMGVSAHLADLFSYQLVQIGLRASTFSSRFSSPLEQLVPLRLTDLLVTFSLPPYSKATIQMLGDTKERGIPRLVMCDRLSAPAAREADHVLAVQTDNLMMTNALAGVCVLMNGLITEIAVRHGDAVDAVTRINQILNREKGLISPE